MSDDLFPRRRPLSPLDGYEDEEIDGKITREKYLAYKAKLNEEAQRKIEKAYLDWDLPRKNDQRTPEPRWEMTEEEELHWRSLQRDFTNDEKYAGFAVTNDPVPEKEVDPKNLPRRYRQPLIFLSNAQVDKHTEEEERITQMIRVEDTAGINRSFRRMYKKGNVRPRNASERRRGYDEAFYDEISQDVLSDEPPKKIKKTTHVPTKGIEKEWIPSNSARFEKAYSERSKKRSERRSRKAKSGSNVSQKSSSATTGVLEKSKKKEVRIPREPDPTPRETNKRIRDWLQTVEKPGPEQSRERIDYKLFHRIPLTPMERVQHLCFHHPKDVMLTEEELEKGEYFYNLNRVKEMRKIPNVEVEVMSEEPDDDMDVENVRMSDVDLEKVVKNDPMEFSEIGENKDGSEPIDYEEQYLLYQKQRRKSSRPHRSIEEIQRNLLKIKKMEQEVTTHLLEQWFDWQESKKGRPTKDEILEEEYDLYLQMHCEEFDTQPMNYKDYEKFFDEQVEKERSRHPKGMTWQEAEDDEDNNAFFEFKNKYDEQFAAQKRKWENALHRAKERIRIPLVKAEMEIVENELIATAHQLNEDKWNGDGDSEEWDQRYLKYIYGSDEPIERTPFMDPPLKETFKEKVLRIAERRMLQRKFEVHCGEWLRVFTEQKEEQERRDAEYKRQRKESGEKEPEIRDPDEEAYEALTEEDKKHMNILRLDPENEEETFPTPVQPWVMPEGPIPILGPEVPRIIVYDIHDIDRMSKAKLRGRGKKGGKRGAPKRGAKNAFESIEEEEGEVGAPIFKVPFPIVEPPAEVVAPEPEPEIKRHERPFWKDLKDTDPRHPNYINPEWIEAATKEFGVPLLPNGRCPSPDDDEYMPKGKSEYQLFKEREAERLRKLELMEYSDEEIVDDDVPVDPEPVSEFQMESSPISETRVSRTPSVLRDEELNGPAASEYQYTADELLGDLEEKVVTEEEDTSGDNGLLEDDLVAEEPITVEEPILVEPETDSVMVPEEEAAKEYGILEKSDEAIKVETPPKKTFKSVKKSVSVEQKSDALDETALLDGAFDAQKEIDEAALLDKEISVEPENLVIPEEDSHALLLDNPSLVEPEFTAPDFQYEDLEKEYGQPEKEVTPAPASFKPTVVEEPTVVEPTPEAPRKRGRPKKRVPPQAAVGTVAKKPAPEKEEEPKKETKKPAAGRRARKPEEAPELVTGPRTKRTYVSANNPLPRVRDFVEPVAPADEEPDRLTGVAGACRAGSPGGTPEKLKHMSDAMRKLIEVDREESVVPQENVPIPVEEIKTEDQWVIPEPITPYSRQSKKRQREALNQNILEEIKEEIEGNIRENDCVIVFAQVGPPIVKIEDDPELVVMRANFNNEQLTQLEPEILPVKLIDPKGKEHPTHMWLITHKMWEGVNELFMTDPEKFSNLMMILVVDSKRRGNVFRYDVTVVNRISEFTPAFINYLSECRKTLTIEQEESMEYNTFFKRYNEMATAFLGDHHISAYILHQVVENIKTVKNAIREDCPAGSLRENEREALATCERILIGQYIESIMKMAHISQVKWATNTHVKRRLEMIYHGWKMFLCTGGFFRLLLAIKMDKPISDVFRKYCQEYVEEIDILYARAIEIYKKTDEEVLKDMEETSGITAADIAKVDADIQVKKSDTHTYRCSTCLIRSQDAYFSSSELLDVHEKIHTSDMEECGKCFSDLLVPELVMHRIITHYSMRVQDDY